MFDFQKNIFSCNGFGLKHFHLSFHQTKNVFGQTGCGMQMSSGTCDSKFDPVIYMKTGKKTHSSLWCTPALHDECVGQQ